MQHVLRTAPDLNDLAAVCVKCLGDTCMAVCKCSVYMLQYDVKRRISADESLKSRYFDSLGQGVHTLSDSQCTICQ